MSKKLKEFNVLFKVICDYEDESEDLLGEFNTYEEAEEFIIKCPYHGEIWIKKVWERK